jgi:protein phosphatase
MGCTLAGVALLGREWLYYCAGDSRVYRMRDGALKQLTRDDTLINIAIEAGRITQEEAERSSVRHTITNCLGTSTFKLAVELGPRLEPGDALLICSDGLHDMIGYADLEQAMAQSGDSRSKAFMLRDRALAAGGRDNIAIIVAQLVCDAGETVSDATMIGVHNG